MGADHSGAHGELAPARVSSHGLICGGSNVTGAGPRYRNQDTCSPRFLPTVIRVGGNIAGLRGGVAAAAGAAAAGAVAGAVAGVVAVVVVCSAARACAAATRARLRGFGMPSSLTSETSVNGCPTFTFRLLTSSILTTGGLFPRTSGLLVPAPSAPVSDAFTTSSTM